MVYYKKYQYLGNINSEVSIFWKPIILELLIKIDKEVRPKFISKWILNKLYKLSRSNYFFNLTAFYLLEFIVGKIYFFSIKTKFASLRIHGIFPGNCDIYVKEAINKCANTCEKCGSTENVKESIQNNWVINLCENCRTKK